MMRNKQYVLAVDLGTSGPKAAVVSVDGEIVSTARAHVKTLYLPNDGAEQDPDQVWSACKEACRQAMSESGVPPADVLAVICTSQYSSIVPVDKDGNHTMNMVAWMDQRGATRRLKKFDTFPKNADSLLQMWQWYRRHGLPPLGGGLSLTHMRWIKYARPEVYDRTYKFLEPMDFVGMKLTGRFTANQCSVFMYLLTDNRKLGVTEYDPVLVKQSTLDPEKLPELIPVGSIIGDVLPEVAQELGLAPGTKVISSLNDTQTGGMATYAFSGHHAGISVGSTSVMITHVDRKRTDARHALISMPSPVEDTYFVMAENGMGGAALEYFLEHLIYADDHFGKLNPENRFALLAQAVDETPPGSGGVLFLPWMSGSIAPSADSSMRGGFLNLSMKTTRSHLARAVLEGVAMNLRWLRKPVEKFVKRRFTHFIYYGGGAESDAWCQIMADVIDAPIHQIENPHYATCLGAGLLAFQRLGMLSYDDFQRLVPIRKVYDPNEANRELYDNMSEQFVEAFKRNRRIFRRLNRIKTPS